MNWNRGLKNNIFSTLSRMLPGRTLFRFKFFFQFFRGEYVASRHIGLNKVLKVFGRSWPITIEPVWSRDNRPLETPYKQPARNQKGPLLTVIL